MDDDDLWNVGHRCRLPASLSRMNHLATAGAGSKSATVGPSTVIRIRLTSLKGARFTRKLLFILFCAEMARSHWAAFMGRINLYQMKNILEVFPVRDFGEQGLPQVSIVFVLKSGVYLHLHQQPLARNCINIAASFVQLRFEPPR